MTEMIKIEKFYMGLKDYSRFRVEVDRHSKRDFEDMVLDYKEQLFEINEVYPEAENMLKRN